MTTAQLARAGIIGLALTASGCSTLYQTEELDAGAATLAERVRVMALNERAGGLPQGQPLPAAAAEEDTGTVTGDTVIRGDGNFINRQAASRPSETGSPDGEVTLNFELADIRDVIKVVFDTLGENYILDPRVQGEVTVQTSQPLSQDLLIPTLQTLLQSNGATMVRNDGVYRILPISEAVRGNLSPRINTTRLPLGYGVRIFPLKFISADEMRTILEPFAPDGGILLADPVRNLLILAGTGQELRALEETIDIFDVNWLKGMSVGMYVLENIDSNDMAAELNKLFGPDSGLPLGGLFRFLPIERLNAVMVITPQAQYLNDVTAWIKKLDDGGGERLYVYEVKFSNAEYLASLLSNVYEDSVTTSTASSSSSGQVAPGRSTSRLSTGNSTTGNNDQANFVRPDDYIDVFQADAVQQEEPALSGGIGSVNEDVRIVADTENNSLLIWASAQNYDKILSSLRRIDVPKRQVLIEATIAEVTLGDDLRYGLQWFFKNNNVDGRYQGTGVLDFDGNRDEIGSLLGIGGGFSYALSLDDQIRSLLEVLAAESRLKVLSSPQVLVVDNQQARIQVGDQQPVLSSTTATEGGNVVQNIQFKDTGVLLEVQPQINAGGLVSLTIAQDVTDVGEIDDATGQRSFLQRSVDSQVAVQSGQTIFLGGLIRESSRNSDSGIPVLHKLPVVGGLFGRKTNEFARTELVVLITPRVINNSSEAVQITSELRERMRGVIPLESPWERRPPELNNGILDVPRGMRRDAPPVNRGGEVIILNDEPNQS